MSEHEIERFLDRACCGVGGTSELRRHLRKELKEHLEEEIEQDIAAGMTREEAMAKAIEEFGDPLVVRDGLQSVHGRRLMSLLIEKSMIWRERTMKTGWKWSFIAHVALVLTIAAEGLLAASALVFVAPYLKLWHEKLGSPSFLHMETIFGFAAPFAYDFLWVPCLLVPLAVWGLFEWKYRSEYKSMVRLGALSFVSLAMFFVMAAIFVSMGLDSIVFVGKIHKLHMDMTPHEAQRIVFPKIVEGQAAFEELGAAISREDWPAVSRSAERLEDAFESLQDVGNSVLVLAGENQRDHLDDIHRLFREIEESSDTIHDRFRSYDHSESPPKDTSSLKVKIQTYFDQLERLYAELKQKSDLFAADRNSNLD